MGSSHNGLYMNTEYVGCPTFVDVANSTHETQQLYIIEHTTAKDRVKINSKKTGVVAIKKKSQSMNPLYLFNEQLEQTKDIIHRGKEGNYLGKSNNIISVARGTLYSLIGVGMHGLNGLNPRVSYKLYKKYVIPSMLHGIKVLNVCKLIYRYWKYFTNTIAA